MVCIGSYWGPSRRREDLELPSLFPKAPCSLVYTWALKGLPYHNLGAYVDAIKLHGAFGIGGRHSSQDGILGLGIPYLAPNKGLLKAF